MTRVALGCHVFAGGFTQGVRRVFRVPAHLEVHELGRETAEKALGVDVVMGEKNWLDSLSAYPRADFLFGNPRCSAFSPMTSHSGSTGYGPWARSTHDIHQFAKIAVAGEFPVVAWESVQQAYTTGRPLLDYLTRDVFAPAGYRVAHLFINSATFDNAQVRRRYFYVAYAGGLTFNVEAPPCARRQTLVRDVIGSIQERVISYSRARDLLKRSQEYDGESFQQLTTDEWAILPELAEGECINRIHVQRPHKFDERGAHDLAARSRRACSKTPFSLHCVRRLWYDRFCPVIHGSSHKYIHPALDRPLTVREISLLMGWEPGILPRGPRPAGQVGKGVCPCVGEWLARQVELCLDDAWGGEDWESSYDDSAGEWVGRDTRGVGEKVINLTRYAPMKDAADGHVHEHD